MRKTQKRKTGIKLVIYGGSSVVVAIGLSFISSQPGSPVTFVLWGLAISGVLVMVKGISAVMG